MKTKKPLFWVLTTVLLLLLCSCSDHDDMVHEVLDPVFINGSLRSFGSESYQQCRPVMYKGEYYVPVEALGMILNGEVNADQGDVRITVQTSDDSETIIPSDFLNSRPPRAMKISGDKNVTIIVDGKNVGKAKVFSANDIWYMEAEKMAEICKTDFSTNRGLLFFGEMPDISANYFSVDNKDISEYYDGYAVITDDSGKYGLVDSLGESVISCEYDYLSDLSGNTLAFAKDGKYGVMTIREEELFQSEYEIKSGISDDRCLFVANEKYGFMNSNGKIMISAKFDKASLFSNGYAICSDGKNYYFINASGKISGSKWDYISDLSNGYSVVDKDGYKGIVDYSGKVLIKAEYDYASDYSEGYFVVGKDSKAYIFNAKGNKKSTIDARYAEECKNGLIAAQLDNGLWGYVDVDGDWSIPARFTSATSFTDGYAVVTENYGLYGLIDQFGDYVIEPSYASIPVTSHGVSLCYEDSWQRQEYLLVNSDGTILIDNIPTEYYGNTPDDGMESTPLFNGYLSLEHEGEKMVVYLTNSLHY